MISCDRRALGALLTLAASLLLLLTTADGCSDSCEEGATEEDGPGCCSDGCGNSAIAPLPRVCRDGAWVCEGRGVVETACANPAGGCQRPREACTGTVGIDGEEPDPAPELCCELSCEGTKAAHRVCKTGVKYECPAGFVPISSCDDPQSACGGVIPRYRENNFKLTP